MPKAALTLTEFVILFSLITSLTALSIDAMLPALSEIGQNLGVGNPNNTQLIISLFIFGMVFGEIVFGPLSDAIGRKSAIVIGLAIYAVGAVVAATAVSMEMMLIGRIIQGFGASGPKIAARALIRDQYRGDAMARILSIIFMVFILVPMIAPAIGQGILIVAGWRMIFVVFVAAAIVSAAWLMARQPETLPPERRIPIVIGPLLKNARLIFGHPGVMAHTVAVGFVFGAFLLYLSTSEALFRDLYDAEAGFPLYFAILALGLGLASMANARLVMRFGMYRLSVYSLVWLIACGLVLLAVTLTYGGIPPFWVFMIGFFAMFASIGILFGDLNALAMQPLGRIAGIGTSVVSSVSSLIAVVVAVVVGRVYDGTATPVVVSFVVCAIIALVLAYLARRTPVEDI